MKIEHVAIWTRDPERLRDFYATYFRGRAGPLYENPGNDFRSYFLSFDSGARLEIMSMPSIPDSENDPIRQHTGIIHIAFEVGGREDVDGLTARLKADGYRVVDGPRATGDGYYESAVLDPDGNRIEVTAG